MEISFPALGSGGACRADAGSRKPPTADFAGAGSIPRPTLEEVYVDLDECFAMIARLSPHAAKLAARMLRKDPAAPAEWAFALEVGLGDRAQGSDPLTTDDLLLIAMDKDPKHFPAGPAAEYSAQQVQAIEFVRAVRRKGPYPVSAVAALGGDLLAASR